MNLIEIAGHLGADPEERFTSSGKRVITLRVAARVRQSGQDETNWWRVSIWSNQFDGMLPYLKKGSAIICIGEMTKPETYVAKDGSTQISLSMTGEMLRFSPFGRTDKNAEPSQQTASTQAPSPQESLASFGAGSSNADSFAGDDLPF